MRPILILATALVATFCSVVPATAAPNVPKTSAIYLELDGIPGEVDEGDFKGQIELQSFSLSGEGATEGQSMKLNDFFVLKPIDAASPKLLTALTNGRKIAKATVTVRGGKDAKTYLKYAFTDLTVSRINQVIAAGGQEELNFRYVTVKVTYTSADGKTTVEGEGKR